MPRGTRHLRGKVIVVYRDPASQREVEGLARLVAPVDDSISARLKMLQEWNIIFLDDIPKHGNWRDAKTYVRRLLFSPSKGLPYRGSYWEKDWPRLQKRDVCLTA